MNNYCVMSDYPEEGSLEFFKTEPEAADYVKSMIKKAEDECDVDGYPKWINDVTVLRIQGEVQNTPDGLVIKWRK